MLVFDFYGQSDIGRVRTNNEDTHILQPIWDEKHLLAVAIDGLGGYEGGEVAANLAKRHIVEYLEMFPSGERQDLLKQAVILANNSIYDARRQIKSYENMGCVLTATLFELDKQCVHMVHIGDTRLYQFYNGQLTKLSHDHTLVGFREECGDLTEEEAMHHPMRNVIDYAVGSSFLEPSSDLVETATFPIYTNCTFLLCSDGLYDMLPSHKSKEILSTDLPIKEKVKKLIDEANEAGGRDNITAILVTFCGKEEISPLTELPKEEIVEKQDTELNHNVNSYIYLILAGLFWLSMIVYSLLYGIYSN